MQTTCRWLDIAAEKITATVPSAVFLRRPFEREWTEAVWHAKFGMSISMQSVNYFLDAD